MVAEEVEVEEAVVGVVELPCSSWGPAVDRSHTVAVAESRAGNRTVVGKRAIAVDTEVMDRREEVVAVENSADNTEVGLVVAVESLAGNRVVVAVAAPVGNRMAVAVVAAAAAAAVVQQASMRMWLEPDVELFHPMDTNSRLCNG